MSLVMSFIPTFLKNKTGDINVLEFGSGDGFQIPYLQKLGNVIASDIYLNERIRNMRDVDFVKCSISKTPFEAEEFDLIFSNHVIEHISDLREAFSELRRIGAEDCLYVFSVPTSLWLLLSIPAIYYNKARELFARIFCPCQKNEEGVVDAEGHYRDQNTKGSNLINALSCIFPKGHGRERNFFACYRSFRLKHWQDVFSEFFTVEKIQPLLLYGTSEWPIIPTTTFLTRLNICSSVLFLMTKKPTD